MRIADSRFGEREEYELPLASSIVYTVLDPRPIKVHEARKELRSALPLDVEFAAALAQLEEHRLIWWTGDVLLGLAVPGRLLSAIEPASGRGNGNSIYV